MRGRRPGGLDHQQLVRRWRRWQQQQQSAALRAGRSVALATEQVSHGDGSDRQHRAVGRGHRRPAVTVLAVVHQGQAQQPQPTAEPIPPAGRQGSASVRRQGVPRLVLQSSLGFQQSVPVLRRQVSRRQHDDETPRGHRCGRRGILVRVGRGGRGRR